MKTKNMAYIALFAVIICICSWISIPMTVPFTLQTFAIFCALLILGGKNGTIAIILYVLMGMVGLPVFSGFRSGVAALAGPTGGYIIGFVLCGAVYWLFEKSKITRWVLLAVGNVICYLFGTFWFVHVYITGGKEVTFGAALMMCVVPYIVPDIVKLVLANIVSGKIKKAIMLHV